MFDERGIGEWRTGFESFGNVALEKMKVAISLLRLLLLTIIGGGSLILKERLP